MARLLGYIFSVLTSAVVLGGALAQEPKKGKLDVDAVFKKLDANTDGKLQKDEFLKLADRFKEKDKARAKLTTTFEKLDTEKMGLTKDQFRKYLGGVKKKNDEK